MERYGLRPDQMLDYKALKGDTSDNIPGVPGVGEKTAVQLLQQFETLDGVYERLDEVKGKLRDRLAEHRESAFMSREVGRIITDLPVELNLDEGRTGRYDRRAVAQRFRELEFRTLIDRLPPSSIAPTGYGPAEQETGSGLQLSLDLLGGARPADDAPPEGGNGTAPSEAVRTRPDAVSDPGGAIEHVDPRIVRSDADLAELEPWLAAHGEAVGTGLGRRRRPAARAAAAGHRDGGGGRLHLVPAVERRPTAARLVRPRRPAAHRPRPEAAAHHAGAAGRGDGGAGHRHAGGQLHDQSLAAGTDAGRPGRQPLWRVAAGAAGERRDRRRGDGHGPSRGGGGADQPARAPGARDGAGRGRHERPVHRGRDAAAAGAGADGAGRRDHRPRPAGRDERRVRRHPGRPGEADLRPGRARVQHRVAEAAGAGPLRRAGAAGHEAHADRLLDGCIGPGGAAREARGGRPHPGAPPGLEAEGHLRRRAAGAGGQRRTPAHDLSAGGGGHRTAVEHRPQPAEHPDPLRAGAAHPARLRRAAGQAAAGRRLLAAGAAHPGPRLRRRRDSRRTLPPTRTSTWPPRPGCSA